MPTTLSLNVRAWLNSSSDVDVKESPAGSSRTHKVESVIEIS